MNRIPQEVIDEIRIGTNIVDVVGQYVQLKKSGKNYFGLCPFHEEKSPSFSVAEDKQIFHCFGCGKGGNVFQFIQEIDGVSFPEAIEKVADLSHIQVDFKFSPAVSPGEDSRRQKDGQLIALHEKAAELYHHILLRTQVGQHALKYLQDRGISEEQMTEFQIGFAPAERTLLKQVFQQENVDTQVISRSGLVTEREDGEQLDRFYSRIMFPIRNAQGKVVAFSGRLFLEDNYESARMPKYLNSPETEIFNKRQVLYNFDQARAVGRKENELVLFEGFMDVISASGAGIKNGVASMGTSLTNEQLTMFQRTVKKVLICYDGDNAGREASYRALQSFTDHSSLDVSILMLPENLDPDDYIQTYGGERFKEQVKNHRESPFTFKMLYFKQDKNLENEHERLAYLDQMIKELASVPSVIEREVYTHQLSEMFDISEEAIQAEVDKVLTTERQQRRQQRRRHQANGNETAIERTTPQVQQESKLTLMEKTEQMLLYRIFHEQTVVNRLKREKDFSFAHDDYQELFTHFETYMMLHGQFVEADFLNYLQEDHLRRKLIEISYLEMSEESTSQEIDDYIRVIGKNSLEVLKKEKLKNQKEAARVGDKELELALSIEIIEIQKKLKNH
ncbi:DNA primase [Vagococcus elongatus]|uniref:DNA primase n=1 Tax=Vagococcus elongatus TaxID=180344 RepID=A0A430ALJ5_9ENTE|nr:DNA primase [Vagococcus elongatus]RSU09010.1 DNA primase [Vagococcus elongatus]